MSVLAGLGDGDGEDLAGAALDVHVAALLDLLSVLTSVLKKRRGEVREEGVGRRVKFGSGSKALSRIIGNAKCTDWFLRIALLLRACLWKARIGTGSRIKYFIIGPLHTTNYHTPINSPFQPQWESLN